MSRQPDYVAKKYKPLLSKNLQAALAHRIGKEFPRLGGPRIRDLCAQMILEVVEGHLRPIDHLKHGQVLWLGISIDDPPRRGKTTAETDLVPIILDICTVEDIQARLDRDSPHQRLLKKVIRLCRQAYDQGALLSNSDLSELTGRNDSLIGTKLAAYERETGTIVPRRATTHDVGSGLTHKRIICLKRYLEGKTSDVIARETYHSIEAVDRYLGQLDRVRHCRIQGLDAEKTAFTLNCTVRLVKEYLAIDQMIQAKNRSEIDHDPTND